MVYLNLLTVALFLQTYPSFFTDGAAFNNKPLSGIFASQTTKMRQNFLIPHLIHWWWACAILLIRYICIGLWSKVESARYFILFYFLKKSIQLVTVARPTFINNTLLWTETPRALLRRYWKMGESKGWVVFKSKKTFLNTTPTSPRSASSASNMSVCLLGSVGRSLIYTVEMLSVYLSHLLIFTFVVCSHLLRISSVRIDWRNSCKETIHILPKLTVTVRMNFKSGGICFISTALP